MKKSNTKRIIALVCIVAVVLLLACMPLIAGQQQEKDGPQASILSQKVTTGAITQTLIGGGVLAQETPVEITVPAKVLLTEFTVSNGQQVKAGDTIAKVDRVSVQEAVAYVQQTLEYLAQEIEKADSNTLSSKITAQAGGIIKEIYAQKGDDVAAVMLSHGALAVVSLDGRMRVTVQAQAEISAGETVQVQFANGKTASGNVSAYLAGEAVILLEDKNYAAGEPVEIFTQSGTSLGIGTLQINSPWKATAYAGTVKSISVSAGKAVSAGDTLMTLSGTGHTAQYQQLVDQRRGYEKMMLQLFTMYQSLQLSAPCDGIVSGIDPQNSQLLKVSLMANAPNGDDSIEYINMLGQVAAVGENGWAVLHSAQPVQVTDYQQLSQIPVDTEAMTQISLFDITLPVPVYEWQENTWVQLPTEAVQKEDVLLFAADAEGNFVWLVRVQKAQTQNPSRPEGENQQQQQRPSGTTGRPAQQQGQAQEDTFTVYATDTAMVAQLIPHSTMTLEISVDEADILKLQEGQRAKVTVDALTGQSFDAAVSSVSTNGTSNGGSSKFAVTLTMERAADMLGGMNATTTITLESKETVLLLPVAALTEQGTKTVVYTGYDEKNEELTDPVEVTVGVSDGENVQILTGLTENDTCYYAYYDTLVVSDTPEFGPVSGINGRGQGSFGGGRTRGENGQNAS